MKKVGNTIVTILLFVMVIGSMCSVGAKAVYAANESKEEYIKKGVPAYPRNKYELSASEMHAVYAWNLTLENSDAAHVKYEHDIKNGKVYLMKDYENGVEKTNSKDSNYAD